MATVLVVAAHQEDRERYGGWLEGSGHEVLLCPGPTAPDYRCVGGRSGTCALALAADLVILDSALPGDDLAVGTPASELVTIYASLGKPVLEVSTLAHDVMFPAEHLHRPLAREDLLSAVRSRSRPAGD